MDKDFDRWNIYKKKLHNRDRHILCKPGAVWWCALGLNIGHEQDGDHKSFERPVLIIQVFGNDTCLCVPLTTTSLRNSFCKRIILSGEERYAITSQLRTISLKRMLREIGPISHDDFKSLQISIQNVIL